MIDETIVEVQVLLDSADLQYNAWDFVAGVFVLAIAAGTVCWISLSSSSPSIALAASFASFVITLGCAYAYINVLSNRRMALIEEALPDFLSIMASNIRSGMTYDRALFLGALKEFGPLSNEVDRAAKEVIGGKMLSDAMMGMTRRIRSETFSKTMRLIVEGVNSGGNLADLLENTALDIRRYSSVRKEIAATVMVYQLFMIAAAAIGAPLLYAVSSIMVEITARIQGKVGEVPAASNMSFFQQQSTVSPEAVFFFSIVAIAVTAFFSGLTSGVISKGKESDGFTYVPLLIIIALVIFFGARWIFDGAFKAFLAA